MSGCADVCLSNWYDGNNEFYAETTVKARKEHKCCECARVIRVGEKYQKASGKSDGDFFCATTCAECVDIRTAFSCGSWTFGRLWEDIREQMFPVWHRRGPYDCLAKLTTESARDACRHEYAQWLYDNDLSDIDPSAAAEPAGPGGSQT